MKLFFCQSNQCKISYIQVKVMCDYYLYLGMQTLPQNKQFCETAKTKINRIKKNYLYAYINVNRKKSTCHESICKNAFQREKYIFAISNYAKVKAHLVCDMILQLI